MTSPTEPGKIRMLSAKTAFAKTLVLLYLLNQDTPDDSWLGLISPTKSMVICQMSHRNYGTHSRYMT